MFYCWLDDLIDASGYDPLNDQFNAYTWRVLWAASVHVSPRQFYRWEGGDH